MFFLFGVMLFSRNVTSKESSLRIPLWPHFFLVGDPKITGWKRCQRCGRTSSAVRLLHEGDDQFFWGGEEVLFFALWCKCLLFVHVFVEFIGWRAFVQHQAVIFHT